MPCISPANHIKRHANTIHSTISSEDLNRCLVNEIRCSRYEKLREWKRCMISWEAINIESDWKRRNMLHCFQFYCGRCRWFWVFLVLISHIWCTCDSFIFTLFWRGHINKFLRKPFFVLFLFRFFFSLLRKYIIMRVVWQTVLTENPAHSPVHTLITIINYCENSRTKLLYSNQNDKRRHLRRFTIIILCK